MAKSFGWNATGLFIVLAVCGLAWAGEPPASQPAKIYVPYDNLKDVFNTERAGVFLPQDEFRRLWAAAQGSPASVSGEPIPYLISTARFAGKTGAEVAVMNMELTVDVLTDEWVSVPIGLGEVGVSRADFAARADAKDPEPMLRVENGRYVLLTKGKGRKVLKIEFVRQLVSQPGLNLLNFRLPSAAITTLELVIPEENMKVDVKPMLAATTTQTTADGKPATLLQAFLGAAEAVQLSWKPKTQAAEELEPVIVADQIQHVHVAEAIITHTIRLNYEIRRRGVDDFTVQLPGDFRVAAVDGANISKWDIQSQEKGKPQILKVKLFAPAKDSYSLDIRMERFLSESDAQIDLSPVAAREAVRQTGLLAISHSPRRGVEVRNPTNLARVDVGRLPDSLKSQPDVTAYRFLGKDYGATLGITVVSPRINLNQLLAIGVQPDRMELKGILQYQIDKAGVFELKMNLPEPWELLSVGPKEIVDEHRLTGKGADRVVNILLKREMAGPLVLDFSARVPRTGVESPVNFALPLADATNMNLYSGQLVLYAAEQLKADVGELQQFQAIPMNQASGVGAIPGLPALMAFEFRALDRAKPAGANFKISLKPAQVSATVQQLVNIQTGSVEQEAVLQYRILYAPTDTFYVKMPVRLADAGVQILGPNIKEKPRIKELPADVAATQPGQTQTTRPATAPADAGVQWAYYKVVLQSPVIGNYDLTIRSRQAFTPSGPSQSGTVDVEPILAAGKISDQNGHIAVWRAENLAIGKPTASNLTSADPSSAEDLPYEPHRKSAILAFKFGNTIFALQLPVFVQQEAAVLTCIAKAAIVEQVLGLDGTLNTHVTFLLEASKGDRIAVALPAGAKLFSAIVNGAETPTEAGENPNQRLLRLPSSAGQITKAVVEMSYSVEKASAWSLPLATLPKEVPVQQTLWRVNLPPEYYLLGYDKIFRPAEYSRCESLAGQMAAGYPAAVQFRLPTDGIRLEFTRPGAVSELSLSTMRMEYFNVIIWLVVFAAGGAMLKLRWYRRGQIILAALVLLGVGHLFWPLFVDKITWCSLWPAFLTLAAWAGFAIYQYRKNQPALPATSSGQETAAQQPDEQKPGEGGPVNPAKED
ncbi:MAG: hypothetical protein HZA50_03115 [Planctomycetes bacterium]|nr:hypothetical protein [Planctomycetota bacterium]